MSQGASGNDPAGGSTLIGCAVCGEAVLYQLVPEPRCLEHMDAEKRQALEIAQAENRGLWKGRSEAASTEQRLAALENRLDELVKVVEVHFAVIEALKARVAALEDRLLDVAKDVYHERRLRDDE